MGKCILIYLLRKLIKYIFVLTICLELGVLLWNQLELLYSLRKEIGAGAPYGPLFLNFLLFILGIFFKNRNDVEIDFSIGHALALWIIKKLIINKKCKV